MKKLALLGAGGHGKVAAEVGEQMGFDEIHFFDGSWPDKQANGRWPVVGDEQALLDNLDAYDGVFVSIGNNRVRADKLKLLESRGITPISLVSPLSIISPSVNYAAGTLIVQGAIINVDSKLGKGVIINTSAGVDHDCDIGDYAHVCPGTRLAGEVTVGEAAWVGIGSSVIQRIRIGADTFVGAGSVVVKDLPDKVKAFGNPARIQS